MFKESKKITKSFYLCTSSLFRVNFIFGFNISSSVGSRLARHSFRIRSFVVISLMIVFGKCFRTFLGEGELAHASATEWIRLVNLIISSLMFSGVFRFDFRNCLSELCILQYFSYFMAWPVIGRDYVMDECEISRRIGWWSDDKSLRFFTWICNGIRDKAMSSTSGLYSGEYGKYVRGDNRIIVLNDMIK